MSEVHQHPVERWQWPALVRQSRMAPDASHAASTHVAVSDYEPCERCGVLRYRRRDNRTQTVDTQELRSVQVVETTPGAWALILDCVPHVCRPVDPKLISRWLRKTL